MLLWIELCLLSSSDSHVEALTLNVLFEIGLFKNVVKLK